MSLSTILKSRKSGYRPAHAVVVMSGADHGGCDSVLEVQIQPGDVIDRLDIRPLLRMRVGIINFDQSQERVLALLDKLADQQVTLFAYSGKHRLAVAEHVLSMGMETIKPVKWGEEMLWRY